MAVNQPLFKIDFKKELETASKGMIMIHDPKLLIKLIVRMIVRKLRIKHAAMILYESDTDRYADSVARFAAAFPGATRIAMSHSPVEGREAIAWSDVDDWPRLNSDNSSRERMRWCALLFCQEPADCHCQQVQHHLS